MKEQLQKWCARVGVAGLILFLGSAFLCYEEVTEYDETSIFRRDKQVTIVRHDKQVIPVFFATREIGFEGVDNMSDESTRTRIVQRHAFFGLMPTTTKSSVYRGPTNFRPPSSQ